MLSLMRKPLFGGMEGVEKASKIDVKPKSIQRFPKMVPTWASNPGGTFWNNLAKE